MIIPLTTEEALEFLLENGLTKHQYINIHHLNKARVCDIFPSYSEVQKVKTTFRPTEIEIRENFAQNIGPAKRGNISNEKCFVLHFNSKLL